MAEQPKQTQEEAIESLRSELRETARERDEARADLAQCYRLSGADPDGNEDWRLAREAVVEVRRLRVDHDAAEDRAEAAEVTLTETQAALKAIGWCGLPGNPHYCLNCDRTFSGEAALGSSPATLLAKEEDLTRGGTTGDPQASRTASEGKG